MASLYAVLTALQSSVSAAVAPLGISPAPQAAIGWPPVNRLQQIGQGTAGPAITIYDRRIGRNVTRWSPEVIAQTLTPATLTTAVDVQYMTRTSVVHITLGGTVTPGDAVSAVFTRHMADGSQVMWAAVVSGGASPSDAATALAAAINADSLLSSWVTAVAAGPVVTLTAAFVNGSLVVASYTGNGGTQTREVARRERQVQIVQWTRTEEQRNLIAEAISQLLGNMDATFGLTLSDGTVLRVTYGNDFDLEDNTLQDVYRHDFLVSAEYPVTVQDQLYAMLAPVGAFTIETED